MTGSFDQPPQPSVPMHIAFFINNKNGTKGIYQNISSKLKSLHLEFQTKWHNELDVNLDNALWQFFFKLCFKASNDSYHIWFQHRILHCTLATQELLNKMSMSNSPTCLSCQTNIESLSHLFYFCSNSKQLWTQLENKIKISTQFTVNFIPCDVLLGYTLDNNNSIAINVILLVTKAYIYIKLQEN